MNKNFLKIAIFSSLIVGGVAQAENCNNQIYDSHTPVFVNQKLAQNTYSLCFSEYMVVYSAISKTPMWSAEHLTTERLEGARGMKRINSFHEEESLPSETRSYLRDYARTGYDRGHMSPSGDMSNAQAQYESFSLANMIPQNPNNNRNLWEGVESSMRNYVEQNNEVYLVTGPIFSGSVQKLQGGELIPTQIYKAVYDVTNNIAGAYLVDNVEGNNYKIISISELVNISGIDPFPTMHPNIKNKAGNLPVPKPHGFDRGNAEKSKKKLPWWHW